MQNATVCRTHRCSKQKVIREELHAEDVVELADAVKLYSVGVVNVQPLLLSHCVHGLTVKPPTQRQKCVNTSYHSEYVSWLVHYVFVLDDLLYIIDRLHHVNFTHQLFGLPVYTSYMASPPTKQKVAEGNKERNINNKQLKHWRYLSAEHQTRNRDSLWVAGENGGTFPARRVRYFQNRDKSLPKTHFYRFYRFFPHFLFYLFTYF